MFVKIDQQKAIEAAGVLLRLTKYCEMDRKRLLALLFLSEREAIKQTGRPLIGGRISALPFGPIHSEVYSLIQGAGRNQAEWSRHFENEKYRVRLADSGIGVSSLSRFEIALLNEISAKYDGYGTWDVAEASHTSDYHKNYIQGTSTTIPLEDIIDSVGRTTDKESILQDLQDSAAFDAFFGATA
jgi:uncharacterized phage-associated protein